MATPKEVEAAGKKMQAALSNYDKTQAELARLNSKFTTIKTQLKSGVPGQMGPAAVELTKIMAKLGPLQKKAVDAKKKMDDALKAFSKVAPSK